MTRRARLCLYGKEARPIPEEYYTLKGYQLRGGNALTSSMEDYLEMICRLRAEGGAVRIGELAARLHVKPSSASKMAAQLASLGYLDYRPYGQIELTQAGADAGRYLLRRHEIVHRFLCLLNHSEDELAEAEKIEHFLRSETVGHLEELLRKMEDL